MRKCCLLVLAITAISFGSANAQTTIDFDDLTGRGFVPTFYHGLTFSGGLGASSWVGYTLFPGSVHSGEVAAWSNTNTWLEFSRATAFDFFSAWLTMSADLELNSVFGNVLTVRGYRGGAEVFTRALRPDHTAARLEAFNFLAVDRVRFESLGGFFPDGRFVTGGNLMLDDIVVGGEGLDPNVVPEPISMTLLGTGLAGIAAVRRRKRRAA